MKLAYIPLYVMLALTPKLKAQSIDSQAEPKNLAAIGYDVAGNIGLNYIRNISGHLGVGPTFDFNPGREYLLSFSMNPPNSTTKSYLGIQEQSGFSYGLMARWVDEGVGFNVGVARQIYKLSTYETNTTNEVTENFTSGPVNKANIKLTFGLDFDMGMGGKLKELGGVVVGVYVNYLPGFDINTYYPHISTTIRNKNNTNVGIRIGRTF